jgi:hypothetical protein
MNRIEMAAAPSGPKLSATQFPQSSQARGRLFAGVARKTSRLTFERGLWILCEVVFATAPPNGTCGFRGVVSGFF